MNQALKYIIFVVLCFVAALMFTRFNKDTSFSEAYTIFIALLALYRACKEEK